MISYWKPELWLPIGLSYHESILNKHFLLHKLDKLLSSGCQFDLRGNGVGELAQFQNVIDHRHEYARQWKKEKGALVFGFFGDYVPEEIIYAAGILPVKIFGSRKATSIADAHISPDKWCFFCRDCLEEGLSGRYDYLDGLVITVSCFHLPAELRQLGAPFAHLFSSLPGYAFLRPRGSGKRVFP